VTDALPEDIRQFVLGRIDSIAEMEALVMMTRAPQAPCGVEQVGQRLYIGAEEARRILERLAASGIAERVAQGYRLAVLPEAEAATVRKLVALYATHLIPITNLIHGKSTQRIRQFADAFQLRKKE
jgi:predicted transcriptional regulator of viral defense system